MFTKDSIIPELRQIFFVIEVDWDSTLKHKHTCIKCN